MSQSQTSLVLWYTNKNAGPAYLYIPALMVYTYIPGTPRPAGVGSKAAASPWYMRTSSVFGGGDVRVVQASYRVPGYPGTAAAAPWRPSGV